MKVVDKYVVQSRNIRNSKKNGVSTATDPAFTVFQQCGHNNSSWWSATRIACLRTVQEHRGCRNPRQYYKPHFLPSMLVYAARPPFQAADDSLEQTPRMPHNQLKRTTWRWYIKVYYLHSIYKLQTRKSHRQPKTLGAPSSKVPIHTLHV